MKIFSAPKNTFPIIQEFLTPYEATCVSLCAQIRKESPNTFIISTSDSIQDSSDIYGILHLDGTLLHCIPQITEDFLKSFKEFSKDKKIKAVNGEEKASNALIQALAPEAVPYQKNDYSLMILETPACEPPETLSCDVEIKRCREDDLESLVNLQKQYIIKEVAPAGKQVSDLECKISLRQILKNQLVFALYDDTEVVAKANTNAIGWNYVQIGGVFTHPLYRRNYYAWHLLKLLCDRIQKTNRKICLYVKTRNTPAIALYKAIGFKQSINFTIAYYN